MPKPTLRTLQKMNASGIHAYAHGFYAELADWLRADGAEEAQEVGMQCAVYARDAEGALVQVVDALQAGQVATAQGRVLVANIQGIMYYDEAQEMADALLASAADPRTAGIVLNMDTPGGHAMAGELIAETLEDIRRAYKLPISAIANDMAASAGAMVAVAADDFFLGHRKAITGSIGTMMSFINIKGFFQSMGLEIRDIYATKSTRKNEIPRALEAGNDDPAIEQILDPSNEDFIRYVGQKRPNAEAKDYEDGRLLIGQQAIEAGIADGYATLESLINNMLNSAQQATAQKTENHDMENPELVTIELAGAPVQVTQAQADELHQMQADAAALEAAQAEVTALKAERDALQAEKERLEALDGGQRAQTRKDQQTSDAPVMFADDLERVSRIANRTSTTHKKA